MFEKISEFWKKYGFEILLVLSIIIIIVVWLMRRGKKGTWTSWSSWSTSIFPAGQKKPKPPVKDSKGEIECRKVMEKIFNKPFPKERPNILRNPVTENFNMELDCYNSDLKIACEYNGVQHYKFVPFFHKNKEAFYNQKYRDELKRRICKENDIFLIEVPYTIKIDEIEGYIRQKLGENPNKKS